MSSLMPAAALAPAEDGGSMVGGPPRVVWHTTESDPGTLAAVVRYLNANRSAPHLVWDPSTGEITQMIPADRAARALEHPAGTPETNRRGLVCVQIEVVGRAARPFTAGPMEGREALLAWLDSLGVPRSAYTGPRMSWATWAAMTGHCGHMHVPGQTHVDPGAIDWSELLAPGIQTPTDPAGRFFVQTVLYARRGSVDLAAATWYMDARNSSDLAVVCHPGAAQAAHAAGAKVVAVGGPACADLQGLDGLVQVNGTDAVDTGAKLAALRP